MTPAHALVERFTRDLLALTGPVPSDARLGVAVSGGPDSLALLLLAHAAMPGRIAAATVDHGLRAANRAEAEAVASICSQLGVPHQILGPVAFDVPRASVQQRARRMRYSLLSGWCVSCKLLAFATAHHRDDQAETFLMRAVRGSGLAGMIGARPMLTETDLLPAGGMAVRPLLEWHRAELAAIVQAASLDPVDDPSNHDPAFDRTGIRALLAREPGLDPAGLARTSANLRDADEAMEWAMARVWAERVTVPDEVFVFDAAGLPREIKRRITEEIVRRLQLRHETDIEARGGQVAALVDVLSKGGVGTLGGVLARGGETWRFAKAPPRRRG